MVKLIASMLLCFVVRGVCSRADESASAETRVTLEKWVETRQLISRTRADWQASKESLQQQIELFRRELSAVQEQSSKLSTNSVQADKERAEAEASRKTSEEALLRARQFAGEFESRLKALLPSLPAPLQETIKPLLLRMPTDPNTRMTAAERLQTIVGALNEIDKFNSAISLFNEKRKAPNGEEIAVETVYAGLGAAYFTNEKGDFAGAGRPGQNGWEWVPKPEIAGTVREVIQIYRNERPARFVSLPAVIQ